MSASALLRLQKVGFTGEQVEALAEFLDTQAASKADVEAVAHRLEARIGDARTELKTDYLSLRAELKQDHSDLRVELKQDISDLRVELKQDVSELKAELKQDVSELKAELKQDISDLRVELKQDISEVRVDLKAEMAANKTDILKIIIGTTIAALAVNGAMMMGTMFGLAKLLGH